MDSLYSYLIIVCECGLNATKLKVSIYQAAGQSEKNLLDLRTTSAQKNWNFDHSTSIKSTETSWSGA